MQTGDLLPTPDQIRKFQRQAAISLPALDELIRLLIKYRPKTILETGPGLSSLVFYRYQQLDPTVEYWSIDHKSKWHDLFVQTVVSSGYDVGNAEAVDIDPASKYYDLKQSSIPVKPFDFILLDGPWDPAGRASPAAAEFILNRATNSSIVVVDDVHRGAEQGALQTIRKRLGGWQFSEYKVNDSFYNGAFRQTAFLVPNHVCERAPLPTVDIGITTWPRYPERLKYLRSTIEHLLGNLTVGGQSPVAFHISAEADGLRDELEKLCSAYPVTLIYNPGPRGLAHNFNHLVATSSADYLLFVEDDWLLQERLDLSSCLSFLSSHKSEGFHAVRFHWSRPFDARDERRFVPSAGCYELLPTTNYFYTYNPHLRSQELRTLMAPSRPAGLETGGELQMNAAAKQLALKGRLRILQSRYGSEFGHCGVKSAMTEKWAAHKQ